MHKKERKGIQIGKKDIKLSSITDDIFINLKDPEDSRKNIRPAKFQQCIQIRN
jgi:hypothetical protein